MTSPRVSIIIIRSLTFIAGLSLILIIVGVYPDFNTLRNTIAVSMLLLSVFYFLIKQRGFGIVWICLGLCFLPAVSIHLARHIWVVIDILSLASLIFVAWWTTNPYWKGTLFEQYVSKIFAEPNFVIVSRTRDISKFSNRIVESDRDPDFVFRNEKTGKTFAVECKWRAKWYKNKDGDWGLHWGMHKCDNYISYGEKFNLPVFVAFGVGGTPEKPKEVYFLGTDQLKYSFLKQSLIRSGKTSDQVLNSNFS